ncbi:hypothetical protein HMPREF9372_3704 [Sporosarcina newyorkensis 2681]|uniref:Uncharacterized protein n=1 Tax=Sporosarcina newyorkensis 2681 TaxID=1027292 RepID=F9DY23_9BACL|nr:hypothetical protein [Sporosarcina newyorkensis]EGQ19308.1 hypothetical protein HMPREF9372_3704 [Sporosarcina newyorkensis 2681]
MILKDIHRWGTREVTYCIGFKSKTAVFLIADSMITSGRNREIEEAFGEHTTFGELVKEESKTMQDRMIKVFKLPGNVLATFAGDVIDALEALGIFRKELERGLEPITAFESVSSAGPFSRIELLIGFIDQDRPKLYSYNYKGDGLFKEEHSTIHLGSGRDHEYLSGKSSQIVDSFTNDDYGDGKTLVYTLAYLQNFSIKNSLISLEVGGFFFGGFVHTEGIQRVWNTTYLMYAVTPGNGERTLHLNYHVSLNRKDDLLLISSSFLDHERVYLQEIDLEEEPDIIELQKQVNELRDDYWEGDFKFVVLLNQLNYGFTVCYMENENKLSEIKIVTDRTKGEVRYRLSSGLVNYLLYPFTLKEEDIDPKWDRNNPAHLEIPIRWFA